MTSKERCNAGLTLWHQLKRNSVFKMTLNEPKTSQIEICLNLSLWQNTFECDRVRFVYCLWYTFVRKHSVTNYTSVMMHTQSVTAHVNTQLRQGGQRTSRSRANNSKQLALQQKITSDKVRKSVISRVLKFQFLCRKA